MQKSSKKRQTFDFNFKSGRGRGGIIWYFEFTPKPYIEIVESIGRLSDATFLFSTRLVENLKDVISCCKVSLDQIVSVANGHDHVNAVVSLNVTLGDHRQSSDGCPSSRVHYFWGGRCR